jgi:hypothetical protein
MPSIVASRAAASLETASKASLQSDLSVGFAPMASLFGIAAKYPSKIFIATFIIP